MTLWGGRFTSKLNEAAWRLNTSLPVDQRLAAQDVRGSLAWAESISQAGVILPAEHAEIAAGLNAIADEFSQGAFTFHAADEDIHTAVERRLGELIGAAAGKLHTGRSRNDQVATDFRLWMLEAIEQFKAAIRVLQSALLRLAEAHTETLMPGYTHLQRAQPITLAHWLLSHFWALERDRDRLRDLRARVAVLPLGSGALAGAPFTVDRAALAAALGFDSAAPNSLDAVSDRDFAAEFLFCAALTGVHLSKLSEQVILFSSAEFGFIELSDAFSTGSSLMPQKKNPDVFELTRGKAGTLLGLLTGLMATLKGLPSAYDKDLQEDKAPVFQAFDTLTAVLPVLAQALESAAFKQQKMAAAIDAAMMATDLADYLVQRGIPFREAHAAAGKAVRLAAEQGCGLDALSLQQWKTCGAFEADVYQVFNPVQSAARRSATGGTAPDAVREQIQNAKIKMQNRK